MSDKAQTTTAIAVPDETVSLAVAGWSEKHLRPFYRGTHYDSWKSDVTLAIMQDTKLRECLLNAMSAAILMRAVQLNASTGLSLNPQHGQAALVVYNGRKGLQVNHMVMKNGLIKKALESRQITKVESDTVYEKDAFTIKKSSGGDSYEWSPALDDRGNPKGYFACIYLADGKTLVEYWTYKQAWDHALKYGNGRVWDDVAKKYKAEFYPDAAYGKSFDGMSEKNVIRSALRSLYLPEVEEIFVAEDETEAEMRDVTEPPPHKGTSSEDLAAKLAVETEEKITLGAPPNPAIIPPVNDGEIPANEQDLF